MSQCLLVDPDAQVQDVLQCGGITMPHEETKIDQVTMSQDAGEDSSQLLMYKSCINHVSSYIRLYSIGFDCILWAVTMSSHVRTALTWHTSCSSRPGQLALGCWSASVGFHSTATPCGVSLTVFVHVWLVCLRANPSKLRLHHE